MPSAKATAVLGPSHASMAAPQVLVAWWVSPLPDPCAHSGHHPGTDGLLPCTPGSRAGGSGRILGGNNTEVIVGRHSTGY